MNDLNRIIKLLADETNKVIDIDNLIHLYLKNSKYMKRAGTYDYESKHLKIIARYLRSKKIYKSTEVTHSLLYDFVEFQQGNGISNNTINKRVGLLKSCFAYSLKQRFISDNPLDGFKMLRIRVRETITIPRYIIKDILEYLDSLSLNLVNARNKTIVYLLLDTGIRLSELVNLYIENINLDSNQINLTYTKSSIDRTVFITEITKTILLQYITLLNRKTGILIVEFRSGGSIYPRYINRILSDIRNHLNINQSISPHKWRHTYATMCLDNGANLEFVRKTLGHANLQTTQKYLHVERKNLEKQHKTYSPLTKL